MTNLFPLPPEFFTAVDPVVEARLHQPRIVFFADCEISETDEMINVHCVDYYRDGTDSVPASEWIVPGTA